MVRHLSHHFEASNAMHGCESAAHADMQCGIVRLCGDVAIGSHIVAGCLKALARPVSCRQGA